jgi:hypothetical protein
VHSAPLGRQRPLKLVVLEVESCAMSLWQREM